MQPEPGSLLSHLSPLGQRPAPNLSCHIFSAWAFLSWLLPSLSLGVSLRLRLLGSFSAHSRKLTLTRIVPSSFLVWWFPPQLWLRAP